MSATVSASRTQLGILLAALSAGSCSTIPDIDGTTELSTYQISRQITCETRQAVIDNVIGFLNSPANRHVQMIGNPAKPFARVDARSYEIGRRLAAEPESIARLDPSELSGVARVVVGLIWSTGVAYNYNLEMTELNNAGGSLNLLHAFPSAARALGLTVKVDLQRQNTTVFSAASTFGRMVKGPLAIICKPEFLVGKNHLYPIAGEIGMRKIIGDFTQQAVFGDLSNDLVKDFSSTAGVTQMARQLAFTTTLDLSINPTVTFTPFNPGNLHVAGASITAQLQRKDLHKLTIGMYLPVKEAQAFRARSVFEQVYSPDARPIVSVPTSGPAEAGAARVLNDLLRQKPDQSRFD